MTVAVHDECASGGFVGTPPSDLHIAKGFDELIQFFCCRLLLKRFRKAALDCPAPSVSAGGATAESDGNTPPLPVAAPGCVGPAPVGQSEVQACTDAYRALLETTIDEWKQICVAEGSPPGCPAGLCAVKYAKICWNFSNDWLAVCHWVCPGKYRESLSQYIGVTWRNEDDISPEYLQPPIDLKSYKNPQGTAAVSQICHLCNVPCNSTAQYKAHIQGRTHRALVRQAQGMRSSKPLPGGEGVQVAPSRAMAMCGPPPPSQTHSPALFAPRMDEPFVAAPGGGGGSVGSGLSSVSSLSSSPTQFTAQRMHFAQPMQGVGAGVMAAPPHAATTLPAFQHQQQHPPPREPASHVQPQQPVGAACGGGVSSRLQGSSPPPVTCGSGGDAAFQPDLEGADGYFNIDALKKLFDEAESPVMSPTAWSASHISLSLRPPPAACAHPHDSPFVFVRAAPREPGGGPAAGGDPAAPSPVPCVGAGDMPLTRGAGHPVVIRLLSLLGVADYMEIARVVGAMEAQQAGTVPPDEALPPQAYADLEGLSAGVVEACAASADPQSPPMLIPSLVHLCTVLCQNRTGGGYFEDSLFVCLFHAAGSAQRLSPTLVQLISYIAKLSPLGQSVVKRSFHTLSSGKGYSPRAVLSAGIAELSGGGGSVGGQVHAVHGKVCGVGPGMHHSQAHGWDKMGGLAPCGGFAAPPIGLPEGVSLA